MSNTWAFFFKADIYAGTERFGFLTLFSSRNLICQVIKEPYVSSLSEIFWMIVKITGPIICNDRIGRCFCMSFLCPTNYAFVLMLT